MRRFYLFVFLAILFSLPAFTQTTYWSENFQSNEEWTMEENWEISGNRMSFFWSPQIENFDCSSLSPIISLHEGTFSLIVTQYLNVFSTESDEIAEISVIHDAGEDIIWSYAISNGSWGSEPGDDKELLISDFAGQDVQFRFRTFGANTFNWNGWYIGGLKLHAKLDKDLAITEIIGPTKLNIGESGLWQVEVTNSGFQPVSDFTVNLRNWKTGDIIGSIIDTDQLESLSTKNYTFEWSSSAAYNTALYGEIILENDEWIANNFSQSHFIRIQPDIDFEIFVWDNDNFIETIYDPEQGDIVQASTVLTRALDLAGFDYDLSNTLPNNLNEYDIVFSTMGGFCFT